MRRWRRPSPPGEWFYPDGVEVLTETKPITISSSGGNGNGDSINVQEAITISELKKSTSADLAKSMCTKTEQCNEGTCLSISYLEDAEIITPSQSEAFFEDTSKIVFTSAGAIIGTGTCAVIC